MYCISLLNVQQKFWLNLSACVVLLEYEIKLVLTGHCFLWDEKQSRHLIYLPSSQGGPTTVAEKCQVLWILCCKVHFYMHGSDRWVSVQTSEKMYQSVNYLSGPCRQPRIVSKDWNLCPEETQHVQNLSVLCRQYDARSKFSQVPFLWSGRHYGLSYRAQSPYYLREGVK